MSHSCWHVRVRRSFGFKSGSADMDLDGVTAVSILNIVGGIDYRFMAVRRNSAS